MVFAIDPGNVQSAYVLLRDDLSMMEKDIMPNEELLRIIPCQWEGTDFAIEMVASYGMAVGETVFETVYWIGRFWEAAKHFKHRERIKRMEVKMHLCHNSRAKDANIRQALIDRFGDVGTKKNPGWFYGFKADMWSAYAVGVTYADRAGQCIGV